METVMLRSNCELSRPNSAYMENFGVEYSPHVSTNFSRIEIGHLYRHIQAVGWSVGWTWARNEVIRDMRGGQTIEQGYCSQYKGIIPHCCNRAPTIVDLMPKAPYDQQLKNCCKGGIVSSLPDYMCGSDGTKVTQPSHTYNQDLQAI
ncbi:hypothetical protein LguiB_009046 [Lonicera macranthoides]